LALQTETPHSNQPESLPILKDQSLTMQHAHSLGVAHMPLLRFLPWLLVAPLMVAGCLAAPAAYAGGCPPLTDNAGTLPPCCATSTMAAGGRCVAAASRYELTLLSFGLEKPDGTELRFGTPQLYDIAAVGAGSRLADYVTTAEIPPGTYTALRPLISTQITLEADSRTADGRRCSGSITLPLQQANGDGFPPCGLGQPNRAVPLCQEGETLKLRDDRLGSFTITEATGAAFDLAFALHNAVICDFAAGTTDARSLAPGAFSMTITKQ
jgi:hypothetical protein